MSGVSQGSRELLIRTEKNASGGVLVAVQDSGPGLRSEDCDRVFDAFYTTKADGMGMGLSICRSILSSSTVGASRPLAKPALARPFSSRCLSEALDTKLRRRVPRFSSRGLRRGANDRLSS